MQTVFYLLGSFAVVVVMLGVSLLVVRALVLMARIEDTRRDLSAMISQTELSLQHVNRLLSRVQEAVDRLRHTLDRVEQLIGILQPAATVGGLIAGAKRAVSGRRSAPTPSERKGEEHD